MFGVATVSQTIRITLLIKCKRPNPQLEYARWDIGGKRHIKIKAVDWSLSLILNGSDLYYTSIFMNPPVVDVASLERQLWASLWLSTDDIYPIFPNHLICKSSFLDSHAHNWSVQTVVKSMTEYTIRSVKSGYQMIKHEERMWPPKKDTVDI